MFRQTILKGSELRRRVRDMSVLQLALALQACS